MTERRPGEVVFERVTKRYGDVVAVDDVSFRVAAGELVTLLGPSGCGKTTTLRMVAGLEAVSGGRVLIGGEDVTLRAANERNVSMVFQSYALFPHMTVLENVCYGPISMRASKAEALALARAKLAMLGLSGFENRLPSELSGGQQQRVAVARSLVLEPAVLLFDEPLSNLDAKLRRRVREEIRELQQALSLTVLYVTHDQEEALAVSDRVIVMDGGKIAQQGTPTELYESPASRFLADFIGDANLVDGEVRVENGVTVFAAGGVGVPVRADAVPPGPATLAVRPHRLRVVDAGAGALEGVCKREMQQSARPIERFAGRYIEPAAVSPGKFAAKETTYAAGAGLGAGLLREGVSDGDPNTNTATETLADFIGAGMGAGVTGLTTAAGAGVRDSIKLATGGRSSVVPDAVAESIGNAANAPFAPSGTRDTSSLADAIAQRRARPSAIPGIQASTADTLADPGVASLEYGRQSGPNSGLYNTRRNENALAANDAIETLQPTGTPGALRSELSSRREDVMLGAQDQVNRARDAFDKSAENLRAVQSGEARGQTVRAALDDALSKARNVEREAWSGIQGEVDTTDLAGAFDQIDSGLTMSERRVVSDIQGARSTPKALAPGEQPDEITSAVLDQFGKPMTRPAPQVSEMTDLKEITSLRSELTNARRAAEANGDPQKARLIGRYVDAIDGFLDQQTEIGDALKNARAVSKDLNDRFTRSETPIAGALARNSSGGVMRPDSNVTPPFVQPDEKQASNLDSLLREADTPDVRASVRDQILAEAGPLVDKPDRLDAYIAQRKAVFDKFPDLRKELGTAAGLRRALSEAEGAQTAATRAYGAKEGDLGTSQVAKYLQFGDERAVDAMAGVVSAKDPTAAIDELLSFVQNDQGAVEGARAAFWKLMERDSRSTGATTRLSDGSQPWRPASLSKFISNPKNRAVMERLYADNPEHLQNIDTIAEELRNLDVKSTAKAPNTSGTPQALSGRGILPSTETLGAYSMAYKRGQVSAPFIGVRILSTVARRATLYARTAEFNKLLDEALLNPELAEQILRENNPANIAALRQWSKTNLGVQATYLDDLLAPDEPTNPSGVDNIEDDIMKLFEGGR